MAKAFSSQIKKMSKKPLKYNPEEVMVVKVDMAQDMFNYEMDIARECLGKFKKEDEPGMANHVVVKFNEEYGEHWMADLNIDGIINILDIILLVNIILGESEE